ncbi:RNA-guided pseudouridylation complex pseudouridine synthase subunit Cbf5 [Candidatus Woesearchaeota archaeon]|nr:MAG: RNA-guided pseudouridylation complex pseudouridine synthase subunit Cbf5 [Candidatus Woesearchaeota archaeon]
MGLLPFEQLKRDLLIKRHCETDPAYGSEPEKRPTEKLLDYGIVNLNKPKGPTSHMASDYVQKILTITKAGHGGSLDPAVTGVLPVALGRATRIVQALLPAGKEYVCIMRLHAPVPREKLDSAIKKFTGTITQLPPVKSAVVRKERERTIYYFEVLEIDGQDVLFRMGCQGGTYVRKVCHDMGRMLGCGAHMAELIRTKAGPFTDADMVSLQDLEDAVFYWKEEGNDKYLRHCIKPVETATAHLGKIWVQDSAVDSICHGASLNLPGVVKLNTEIKIGELVAVMTLKGELVALGDALMDSAQMHKDEKGTCVKIHKVFMQEGTYPKMKRPAIDLSQK